MCIYIYIYVYTRHIHDAVVPAVREVEHVAGVECALLRRPFKSWLNPIPIPAMTPMVVYWLNPIPAMLSAHCSDIILRRLSLILVLLL